MAQRGPRTWGAELQGRQFSMRASAASPTHEDDARLGGDLRTCSSGPEGRCDLTTLCVSTMFQPDRHPRAAPFSTETAAHPLLLKPRRPQLFPVALPLVVKWGHGRRNLRWSVLSCLSSSGEPTRGTGHWAPKCGSQRVSQSSCASITLGTQETCKYLSPAWSFRAKTLENPVLWLIECGPDAAAAVSPRSQLEI